MALLSRSQSVVSAGSRKCGAGAGAGAGALGFAIVLGTLSGCGDRATEQGEQAELAYARKLQSEAKWLFKQGQVAEAIAPTRQALEIRRRILGEDHPDYATNLMNLGEIYEWMCDYAQAERLYQQALDVRKHVLGEEHPDYAQGVTKLARLYQLMGDYASAERLYQLARDVRKKVLSEDHPDHHWCLTGLGTLYHSTGDYVAAEPLLIEVRDFTKKVFGEGDEYASSLNNLALLYDSMGEYHKAESLYLTARDLTQKVGGEEHPNYPSRLNNLAALYNKMGKFDAAETMLLRSGELARKLQGEKSPVYISSLNNLADLYQRIGDYDKAKPLYLEAHNLLKKVVGQEHAHFIYSLANLAGFYYSIGDFEAAEPLYLDACDRLKKVLGEEHPWHATTLCNLASLYRDRGDFDKSDSLFRYSLEVSRKLLDGTASVQSEHEQLQFSSNLRYRLDHYISLAFVTKHIGQSVYDEVLDWKGATLVRQRRLRQVAGEREVAATFARLQSTARRLSGLLRIAPPTDKQTVWKQQIDELTEKKDELEAELIQKSGRFRAAKQRIHMTDLLAALPNDTVLVDFLEFQLYRPGTDTWKKREPQPRFVAFVIRDGQPVEPIDLGPAAAINQAVTDWRTTFGASTVSVQAGEFLRKHVWEPLEPRLKGVRRVLISPDKALGRLPFYALPGKKPNSYLIEDYVIASIPVPQLLPSLMQPHDGKRPEGDLLLIGDVDYSADPQGLESSNGEQRQQQLMAELSFPPLPGTAEEIASIAELYDSVHGDSQISVRTMRSGRATESAFRREAANYRMLHLATHGYFADPTQTSVVGAAPNASETMLTHLFGQPQAVSFARGFHPGMLSGLALTGANQLPQPGQVDGILMAQEIAFMPLEGVELVVLSACETGLGPTAGGEGLLGVQRAFQVAGARTTVASLWKVDDQATAALMRLFYFKLWNENKSPVDALRESQLALYRQPNQIEGLASTRGPNFGEVVKIVESQQDQSAKLDQSSNDKRAPIGQWAAFVLSGDWR